MRTDFRKAWMLCLLVLLSRFAWAANPAVLYRVEMNQKVIFFIQIDEEGTVIKAYPKPQIRLGKLEKIDGGKIRLICDRQLGDGESRYPLLANVVLIRLLDIKEDKTIEALRSGVHALRGHQTATEDIELEGWDGPHLDIDWVNIKFIKVKAEEIQKITALEKAFQGKWRFVGETVHFDNMISELEATDDPIGALPFKKIEFCLDGKCILGDKYQKFYWVDGKLKRLSLQKSLDPKEYENEFEFDVLESDSDHLLIREQGKALIPSMQKIAGKYQYPAPESYSDYRFERVKE